MDNYGENYAYGLSPVYKDGSYDGTITISKVDRDTGALIPKTFPVVDCIPLEVQFGISGVLFVPKEYLWDFGDGSSSTESNPRHTYVTYGYHRVLLAVRDEALVWSEMDRVHVNSIIIGKLDFVGSPRSGGKPLSVTFFDESVAPSGYQYTGIQWDFGDTYVATGAQPPPHSYLDYGSYNVSICAGINPI